MIQLMKTPRGTELVRRYVANYGLSSTPVTEGMVNTHWALEQQLRTDILRSDPESRARVVEEAYTILYEKCPWVNISFDLSEEDKALWRNVLGDLPLRVYEVGSGHGLLISFLASMGHNCVGTEITSERGERWSGDCPNLSWAATDGVRLDRFEREAHYDVVISNQVVEHLHPDDLTMHFQGAFQILRPGGRYLLTTPHLYSGPADLSRVFRERYIRGLHLREYTYRELVDVAKAVGFLATGVVTSSGRVSSALLRRGLHLERLLRLAPPGAVRRKATRASRLLGFDSNIFLALSRPVE